MLAEPGEKEVSGQVLVCNPKHVPVIRASDSELGGAKGRRGPLIHRSESLRPKEKRILQASP